MQYERWRDGRIGVEDSFKAELNRLEEGESGHAIQQCSSR